MRVSECESKCTNTREIGVGLLDSDRYSNIIIYSSISINRALNHTYILMKIS